VELRLKVNDEDVVVDIEPQTLLVELLRDHLGLTGVKVGCDSTSCGACTVVMNGRAVKACTVLAIQARDTHVETVEGLALSGELHPVQDAFTRLHALQCGFCTPGMIMSAVALLQDNADPTEDEIRHAIEGNICRCTGYINIVYAVQDAAAVLRGEEPEKLAQGAHRD
jgi:carbon-monoxide dehydrogenase small subunit